MRRNCLSIVVLLLIITSCKTDKRTTQTSNAEFATITTKPSFDTSQPAKQITKVQAIEDLDELAHRIETTSSYVQTVDFDYKRAIEAIKTTLDNRVNVPQLALQIHKLIQNIGDSHAWVNDWKDIYLSKRFSPAKYGRKNNRIIAYKQDASGLLATGFPYVTSIDGVSIDKWFKKACEIGSGKKSSKSSQFFRGRIVLEYLGYMRSELGLEDKETVVFELESEDKKSKKTIELPVENTRLDYKPFGLPKTSRLINETIGYLRIYSQSDQILLESIDSLMNTFKNTKALIIDARQCGGGLRKNIQTLFPYFMNSQDGIYIPNVARLRIPDNAVDFDPKGKLGGSGKGIHYPTEKDVTEEELKAYKKFLTTFEPSVVLPEEKFTDYYFFALKALPDKYFYDRPVYVLIDFGVGSAGDIFVSVFKGWRNVTLIGTPSNGRSGHSKVLPLKNSQIPVRLSTMVSYQKTGELYDWVGIKPDIYMEPEITDWLETSDTLLDRVLKLVDSK